MGSPSLKEQLETLEAEMAALLLERHVPLYHPRYKSLSAAWRWLLQFAGPDLLGKTDQIPKTTARPDREMPSLKAIATHHGIVEKPARCWKCGWFGIFPGWTGTSGLERAHVIDRALDGLDIEPNLRPLCASCHKFQPSFEPGDEELALRWFDLHEPGPMTWVNEVVDAIAELADLDAGRLERANTLANGFYRIDPDWLRRLVAKIDKKGW